MADQTLWDDLLPYLPACAPVQYAHLNTGSTIEAMARAVLAGAPAQCTLVGFSMGGYVARAIAHLAPARVTGLILVATSARPDQPELVGQRIAAARQASVAAFHGLSRAAIRASLHAGRADDTAMIERVRAMGARLGAGVFQQQSAVVRAGDVGTLADIACPTLVITGAGDQLRSVAEGRELADAIPGADFALIEGAGHMLPLEAPAALGAIMSSWLARR